jgi:mRNA interferase ChpB
MQANYPTLSPTPKRGDIWLINLNPTAGREQQGYRPVLVISSQAFNRSGLALVCPVTQGGNQARHAGFAVTLMGVGAETQGVVMSNQSRTVDMATRSPKFVETVPSYVVEDVIARLQTIID